MKNFSLLIVLSFIFFLNDSFANIIDIETTRLKGTSGAGTGSILLNEAAILNPASIAFHSNSSLYYNKESGTLKGKSDDRIKDYKPSSRELLIISDTSSSVKGGFSLEKSKVDRNERLRVTSSSSAPIGKSTAIGFLLRYTEDKYEVSHKTYTQLDIGIMHIFSEKLTFGAVLNDPGRASNVDPTLVTGIQYNVFTNFDLILDAGVGYQEKPEENTFQRMALQLKVFNSLFLRSSRFHDKIQNTQGTSWGISWVGPKLSIDYAYRTSTNLDEDESFLYDKEKFEENSIAIVLVF
jgi:hypothetical protein